MYGCIIFVQDSDTLAEVEQFMSCDNADVAIDYLAQWDNGEYDMVCNVEELPKEKRYYKGCYILIQHPLYYALYKKID